MTRNFKSDFAYFLEQLPELIKKNRGRWVVISDRKIYGIYNTESEAIEEACKEIEMGKFLVQLCDDGPESNTQTFHSRVVFA